MFLRCDISKLYSEAVPPKLDLSHHKLSANAPDGPPTFETLNTTNFYERDFPYR